MTGAEGEARDNGSLAPLHLAAISAHKAVLKLLLGKRANVGPHDWQRQTPLHLTAGNVAQGRIKATAW